MLALVHDFPFRSQAGEIDLATELAGVLAAATADRPEILPVFVSLTSGDPSPEIQETLDAAGGIPLLRGAVPASAAIARLAWWEGRRTERAASGPWRAGWRRLAADRTPFMLDETDETRRGQPAAPRPHIVVVAERESLAELSAAGIPTVQTVAVPDADAAVTAAEMLGWPVVLKLDAIGVAHKTDVGGVEVGLADVDSVRAAAERILAARGASIRSQRTGESAGSATIRGLLVQQMAPSGVELLIGMRRDRLFGQVVIVGLGGVFAEILDDVAIRLAPLATEQATAMLDELRGAAILRGVRGGQGVDRDAVARLLVVLGDAAVRHPEWIQVDINPVIASPTGAIAVDALIEREA